MKAHQAVMLPPPPSLSRLQETEDHQYHHDPRLSSHLSDEKYWETQVTGILAIPAGHPDNKKAALFSGGNDQAQYHYQPYLHDSPVD
ncbi:conserved hypothetical protein [Ricinus communis]|uniref:Uncharacterized protein n=1 Tax=Ricinus communis TaxID=3988 RepID=B9RH11_RICCO|nr:conserved hypothetical protein [Ricinus communis]